MARLKKHISEGRTVEAKTNVYKSRVGVVDAAEAVATTSLSDITGILHIPGPRLSIFEFFAEGLHLLGLSDQSHLLVERKELRQSDTSLITTRCDELNRVRENQKCLRT